MLAAGETHNHDLDTRRQSAQAAHQAHRGVGGHAGVHYCHVAAAEMTHRFVKAGGASHHSEIRLRAQDRGDNLANGPNFLDNYYPYHWRSPGVEWMSINE